MSYDVAVAGTEISFPCDPEQTILDAAESAGFSLPYSCRKGVCSSCEGGLTLGSAEVKGRGAVRAPRAGVLFCQARPRSHLEIAPKRIVRRGAPARKVLTATVYRANRPAPDVTILDLRFPIGVRSKFKAGQYLKVLLDNGDTRNYSLANPPHENDGAQLHVRHIAGGYFSERILKTLAKGHTLLVEVPYGEFSLDHTSSRPVILVATGTGFAPVRSILEDQLRRGLDRPVRLYWGGRRSEDLYALALVEKWKQRLPGFSFVPVLSQPGPGWSGRTGRVHLAVLEDYADLRRHEVYACGNPAMTSAAAEDFVGRAGLAPDRFYRDAFVPSGEPVPSVEPAISA